MAKKYIVTVNGTSYEVVVEDADPNASAGHRFEGCGQAGGCRQERRRALRD